MGRRVFSREFKFEAVKLARDRGVWPATWLCDVLGVSRSGFHAWLTRTPSARSRNDKMFGNEVRLRFLQSDCTYGARRVWHDVLAEGTPAACIA